MLTFTLEAKQARKAFYDALEGELRSGGELYDVRDVASKTADNAARLATLFRVSLTAWAARWMLKVLKVLVESLLGTCQKQDVFLVKLALPEELANAVRLDAWLIEYGKRDSTHIIPAVKHNDPGRCARKH